MKNYKIAVAGTGYVGLSLGVLLSQHHQVVAVDIVQAKVDMINNKKSPIQDDYLKLEKERLLALKAAQYDTYTYYKDYQKELRTACANVDNILGQHHIRDHTQRTEQTL